MPPFETSLRLDGTTAVVAIGGELDLASAPLARQALARAEALGPAVLLLDLAGLEFLDSSGVSVLLKTHERAVAAGRRVALLNCTRAPRRVIELLGLAALLEMIDDPSASGAAGEPGR